MDAVAIVLRMWVAKSSSLRVGATLGGEDASGSDLPIGDQAMTRTMPDVFKLSSVPQVPSCIACVGYVRSNA